MKAITLPLAMTMLAMFGEFVPAQADQLRLMDDHAYHLVGDAREIRWAVRDSLAASPHLPVLCRISDGIYRETRALQDAIVDELSPHVICREIEHVRAALCDLNEQLSHGDTGVTDPGCPITYPFGYRTTFFVQQVPAACPDVSLIRAKITAMEQCLAQLHALLDAPPGAIVPSPPGTTFPPLGVPDTDHGPTQRGPQLSPPSQTPTAPSFIPSGVTRRPSHREFPIQLGEDGSLVFRIGRR
jgi:hypothetical protein